jgi:ATP/ADP translocase
LATMSLAQGLCNSLMEFAWKCHMRLLYPSPADFTAFLGEWLHHACVACMPHTRACVCTPVTEPGC